MMAADDAVLPEDDAAAMAMSTLRYVDWSVKAAEIIVAASTAIHWSAVLGSTHASCGAGAGKGGGRERALNGQDSAARRRRSAGHAPQRE